MPQPRCARLGQHFLSDPGYRRRIASLLDLRPAELTIEIGPGQGAMTRLLAGRAGKVVGIELDRRLAESLERNFPDDPRIEIIQADILRTDLREICRKHGTATCFLFGSLPYYITSPILHQVLRFSDSIRSMALLVQQEVAERLVAEPGSRDYGYLSVFVQAHASPRSVMAVPPSAFSPRPRVHSSLVAFKMRAGADGRPETAGERFLDFVKRCFAQKRKKLVNNLSPGRSRETIEAALDSLSLSANARAEELTLAQFRALFERLRGA